RDHQVAEPPPAGLPRDRDPRALRPEGPGLHVGVDDEGGGAPQGVPGVAFASSVGARGGACPGAPAPVPPGRRDASQTTSACALASTGAVVTMARSRGRREFARSPNSLRRNE